MGCIMMLKQVPQRSLRWCQQAMEWLRQVSGDDAYERYVLHHAQHHDQEPMLDRRAFYLHEQQRKWNGVKRCC